MMLLPESISAAHRGQTVHPATGHEHPRETEVSGTSKALASVDVDPLTTEGWSRIRACLPEGWQRRAKDLGLCRPAIYRRGKMRAKFADPEVLLRMVLRHAQGTPLVRTVALAKAAGLTSASGPGLHLRMRVVGPWLSELAVEISFKPTFFGPDRNSGFRIFSTGVAAASLHNPRGAGRIHYRIDALTLRTTQVIFSKRPSGLPLSHFDLAPGDLDLADASICDPDSLVYAVARGADVITRLGPDGPALVDTRRHSFDVMAWLETHRTRGELFSTGVTIEGETGTVAGRLVAVRLRYKEAVAALRHARRNSGGKIDARMRAWSEYVVLLTTVPEAKLTNSKLLVFHRFRHAIINLGQAGSSDFRHGVPASNADNADGWISGRLLLNAITRRLAGTHAPSAPWEV